MSVDSAVDRVNVAVTQAIYFAVTSGYIQGHKCPAWFSGKLKAYIKTRISVIDVTRSTRVTVL
jgi:hypothetical protein